MKPKDPDYTLNIFHHVDKEQKKVIAFLVQTTKVFVSFQYEILFQVGVEGRTITLKLQGLHAPEMLMPGSGPAKGLKSLEGLFGHYKLVVKKQDKSVNEFDIEVTEKDVTLLKVLEHPFIVPSTDSVALT